MNLEDACEGTDVLPSDWAICYFPTVTSSHPPISHIYLHIHVYSTSHILTPSPPHLSPPPQDPGGQQVGFLLGSLGITVALTSEITARGLPKEEGKDHIVHFKGWPRLTWFVTEHLPKPPKDWTPPQRPQPDTPAYIEVRAHTQLQHPAISVVDPHRKAHTHIHMWQSRVEIERYSVVYFYCITVLGMALIALCKRVKYMYL